MATPSAVPRTAPIAIAPKPSHFNPSSSSSNSRRGTPGLHHDAYAAGMNGHDSADSDTLSSGSMVCEFCSRRRIKCVMGEDDDSGACVSCQVNGLDCSLNQSPQPRKRKLARDFADDGMRGSPGRHDNRRLRQDTLSISSTAASNSLIEEMANFGGPTMLKRTLGLQNDRYSQYIGPTTDFEPSLINLSPFDNQDESLLARGTQIADADEIEKLVAPHGKTLIDLYFEIIHPSFPIIQKEVINWWDHAEELSSQPRPDVKALEKVMRSSLTDAMWRPKLSTIQAGLLLSQRPEGDQWAPTAQLVAIAQELGLHLDCTHWKIPLWEKGLRKRLAWALYMQDKWGALVHGRPSHIFQTNWVVQPILPGDFPDVDYSDENAEERLDLERGRTLFVQMIHLSQILAEIQDTFYTLQAMQNVTNAGPQGIHLVLSLAKPIQLKLKEWYSSIPAVIRMDNSMSAMTSGRLSSIGHLHLAYFATEISLHRRIIRSLAADESAVDFYLLQICRSAAKARLISAMDFVNRLTPNHLRAFWFFASKTNFALIGTFGSLLWATSPGREEADWYRRRLAEYRWTLSVSSKPGEGKGLTAFAMGMLDISTGLLKKLPEKPELSRSGSALEMEAVVGRRQSLLSMSMSSMPMEFQSGMHSADISGAVSPGSQSDDSSDEMYDNFAPTSGMASARY